MARVHRGVAFGRVSRLISTCVLYVASVVGAMVFYRTVEGQPVEAIGSFLVLFAGPVIAVAVFRRPPTILVPIVLLVPYFVVVALSIASEYDESRWSYSGWLPGRSTWPSNLLLVGSPSWCIESPQQPGTRRRRGPPCSSRSRAPRVRTSHAFAVA